MRSSLAAGFLLLAACAAAPSGDGSSRAERLYRGKCTACHRAYPRDGRTRAEWEQVMSRMAPRAHLRDDERMLLLRWLQEGARDAAH